MISAHLVESLLRNKEYDKGEECGIVMKQSSRCDSGADREEARFCAHLPVFAVCVRRPRRSSCVELHLCRGREANSHERDAVHAICGVFGGDERV